MYNLMIVLHSTLEIATNLDGIKFLYRGMDYAIDVHACVCTTISVALFETCGSLLFIEAHHVMTCFCALTIFWLQTLLLMYGLPNTNHMHIEATDLGQ